MGSPVTSGPIGTGTLTIGANNNVKVFASGGTHTVGNAITFGASPLIISGTNNLTLSGAIDLGASTRTIQVDNTGASVTTGAIGSSGGGLIKTGTGNLTLADTNTYTGTTTVNAGALLVSGVLGANSLTVANKSTLAGTGTINGTTTVQLGGTLQAGLGSNDTSALTISNSLTLAGNSRFNLNRTNAQTANKVSGLTAVNYGGTLTVTNVGDALQSGDTFTLFTSASYAGSFTNYILPPLTGVLIWNTNGLATNGTISVVVGISPTALVLTSSSNPSGYLGAVNFTATVTPTNAAGVVTFYNGATPFSTNSLVAGVVSSASISTLARGTNTITASYGGAVNFYGSTNTLAQVVTNHAPTVTLASYYRGPVATWRIALTNLVTNATDVDSDTLTITAFGTSTNGITLTTNSGFALYNNTNLVNDQFTYTVDDGFGGTATGTVNLTSQAFITGQNATVTVGGSTATVSFAGIPGFNYTAQRSTNLVGWAAILTTNAPAGGLFQVIDDFSDLGVVPGSAYYRLIYNP